MRINAFSTTVISLTLSFGMFGSAAADPDGSQRLRGLGDRVFLVEVEVITAEDCCGLPPVGFTFANCYFFEADGTWIDPAFPRPSSPAPGTWIQHSTGAATTYSAFSDVGILLWQEGAVTPARGKGVLQLEAYSTVFFGDFPLATFRSVGEEVDECPL